MSDTPRTDKLYEEVWRFTNETDAVDALISMRDLCRELERENAALRADKERLDWLASNPYLHTNEISRRYPFTPWSTSDGMVRAAIDAARKEAQP